MHGLRWIGSARLLTQLITWGLTAVTVRLLEPRDYGIVATAGLFTVFAEMLLDGGLTAVLISRASLPSQVRGAAVTAVFLVGALLSALIIAIAPAGSGFFKTPALAPLLRVASLNLPLAALTIVPAVLLSKEMRFRQIALVQAIASVLQGIATLLMAYNGAAYWSLTLGTLCGTVLRVAMLWGTVPSKPWPNLKLSLLRPYWADGTQMVVNRILYFTTSNVDNFLLGRMGGPTVLGAYSLAKNLSHSALDQLAGIVNQVSLPAFAARAGDTAAQLNGLRFMTATASTLVFPFFWLAGVLSQVAFPLIFGSRWGSMVLPFMAFSFILPLRSVYQLLDYAVVGSGRIFTTFKNMLTWSVILVPLIFVGAHYGASATAAAWVVGFPIIFGFAMVRIARAFNTDVRQFLKPVIPPAACAALSCLVVEVAVVQLRNYLPALAQLLVEIPLAGVTYLLLMRQFGRSHYDQMLGLIGRLFGR